jgi:hypothetical protein
MVVWRFIGFDWIGVAAALGILGVLLLLLGICFVLRRRPPVLLIGFSSGIGMFFLLGWLGYAFNLVYLPSPTRIVAAAISEAAGGPGLGFIPPPEEREGANHQQAGEFSRRPLHELLGRNVTLMATDIVTGHTVSVELTTTGWMKVDPFEKQIERFSSPNSACIGFKATVGGWPFEDFICNATRDHTDTSLFQDGSGGRPVELHEGDLFFISGSVAGHRYHRIR